MSWTGPWVDHAETHSAVVFFVGERAYKLKKPVRFDFLDFSTRERREDAVRREVELNRRIAPDVYLGVADVLDVDGSVCDHLVVMRRLPATRRLSTLVRSGEVSDEDVRSIARVIATFHAGARRDDAARAPGSPDHIAAKLDADLRELHDLPTSLVPRAGLDEAARRATRYVAGRAQLFGRRVDEDRVCDGHGDLLADDVFLLDDGPRVLDCLDFSDELRCGDVLADLAFLAMDLEFLGAPDLSARLVEQYDELSGERHPETLLDFYVALRALVRVKVSALRVLQGDDTARPAVGRFLDVAVGRLRRSRVALVLVGGPPGTGKSTVARAIAEANGWVLLRSDVVRKELAGVDPEADANTEFGTGLYTAASTRRVYDEMLERARVALQLGESVVLDASWSDAAGRVGAGALAASTSSDLVQLRCTVDDAVADERLRHRRAIGQDPSDADPNIAATMRKRFAPWPGATVVETSRAPEHALEVALDATVAGPDRP